MPEKSEREKMLAGEPYLGFDPALLAERTRAKRLLREYNRTTEEEMERRAELLGELLGRAGKNVWIEPPFFCDYGTFLELGDNVYLNANCVVLDCNWVRIGDNTKFGPAVQIYAAYHPVDAAERIKGPEFAAAVTIGRNVWVGGGAILLHGVSVGDNTTIGAGSVVTRDIPANVLAVGNPCRVVRHLA
jgi:maltose O-acetyltransferase